MGQDPNFHISVPSGWAKLDNVFHVRICPMHYLSHDRALNSAAFMWLSPISIILLFKINIFLFVSDFQLISKINLFSMIVLMKCNCNNTRGYQFWLDVSISWKKAQITINLGKTSCHFTTTGECERLLCTQYWCYKDQISSETAALHFINWYLHIVDTSNIWVAKPWWIIRSYPYPQNSGIPEMVTFFKYMKKTNSNLAPSKGTHFGTTFIHFNSDFIVIYISFWIYPYAFLSPVPHSPIQRSMGT